MRQSGLPKKRETAKTASPSTVRLDQKSKHRLGELASQEVIALTPEEQLSFSNALNERAKLTPAQRRLGAMMRGQHDPCLRGGGS
jgi:hypothetical protein